MADVQKWEYSVLRYSPDEYKFPDTALKGAAEVLAGHGNDGWELAGVAPSQYPGICVLFFKRPKFEEPARIQPMKP